MDRAEAWRGFNPAKEATPVFFGLPNHAIVRAELQRLFPWLKDKGVTAILTAEKADGTLTRHNLEEYVADCVILLDHRVTDQISTLRLRVVNYSGSLLGTKVAGVARQALIGTDFPHYVCGASSWDNAAGFHMAYVDKLFWVLQRLQPEEVRRNRCRARQRVPYPGAAWGAGSGLKAPWNKEPRFISRSVREANIGHKDRSGLIPLLRTAEVISRWWQRPTSRTLAAGRAPRCSNALAEAVPGT